jgi:outer membrane receptor protein involved in Fe transport
MRNTKTAPIQEDEQRAGWLHGPLKRRANGGFDWTKNSLTLGANLQYFGRHLILAQGQLTGNNELYELMQGSTHIPSQRYLDIYASWRATVRNFGPLSNLTVDLGVINVLDKAPPRESSFIDAGPGYRRYGDPRMRRFELSVSAHF